VTFQHGSYENNPITSPENSFKPSTPSIQEIIEIKEVKSHPMPLKIEENLKKINENQPSYALGNSKGPAGNLKIEKNSSVNSKQKEFILPASKTRQVTSNEVKSPQVSQLKPVETNEGPQKISKNIEKISDTEEQLKQVREKRNNDFLNSRKDVENSKIQKVPIQKENSSVSNFLVSSQTSEKLPKVNKVNFDEQKDLVKNIPIKSDPLPTPTMVKPAPIKKVEISNSKANPQHIKEQNSHSNMKPSFKANFNQDKYNPLPKVPEKKDTKKEIPLPLPATPVLNQRVEEVKSKRKPRGCHFNSFIEMPAPVSARREPGLVVDEMSYENLLELDRHNYDKGNGFDFDTLSFLNQYKFEARAQDVANCNVCQENLENGQNVTCLKCGHVFHYDCIYEWLSRKKKCSYNCDLSQEDFFT
jgi:hypothetical protein